MERYPAGKIRPEPVKSVFIPAFLIRKALICCFLFLFFSPPDISYAGHISGYLQFSYSSRIDESDESRTEEWDFEQKYKLRYWSYVYHPRLLDYTLSGTFSKLNGNITPSGDFDSKATDYDATLNFFKITPFPFSLYASSNTTTSVPFFTSITSSSSSLIEQTRDIYGLSGSLDIRRIAYKMYVNRHKGGNGNGRGRLKGRAKEKPKEISGADKFLFFLGRFPIIHYRLQEVNRTVDGSSRRVDERVRSFKLYFKKGFEKANLRFNYDYANKLDHISDAVEKRHSVDLNVLAKLAKKVTLSEDAFFHTNSLRDSVIFSSRTRLNYSFSPRLKIEARSSYENKDEKDASTDSFINSVTASYSRKLTKDITASSIASVNQSLLNSDNSFSEAINGSLSYSRALPANFRFSASTAAAASATQGDRIEDQTSTSAAVGSTLTKGFIKARTTMGATAYYFYSRTSMDKGKDGYKLRFDITNNLIKRLAFKSKAEYINENYTDERAVKEEFTTDTSINYSIPLGRRGSGVLIAGFETKENLNDRKYAYGKFDLRYAILRNLSLKSSVKYAEELLLKQKTLYASAGLSYFIRQISVNLKYEFFGNTRETLTDSRQHLLLRLTRYF
jgi:hypothetical protein